MLNHREGAALLDEQPASLKITVNALLSSAPSPILTSGRGRRGGERLRPFPKALFTAALRFSANHVGNQAGVHFLFPSQDGAEKKKKKSWCFFLLRFHELKSTFHDMHRGTVAHVPSAHPLEAPENAAGRQHPRSAAGRPMNKR